MYLVKIPRWAQFFYKHRLFRYNTEDKVIYLTFDDGPNAATTPFILDLLKQYNAKATFFCIGKNIENNPELQKKTIAEGHLVGSHTFHHLNGWKENKHTYVNDLIAGDRTVGTDFFRPPYGRMRKKQEMLLAKKRPSLKVVMWSVLSGDFDMKISPEKCWENVRKNTKQGDIVVFHDSDKAWQRLQYTLPLTLEYFTKLGYRFDVLY